MSRIGNKPITVPAGVEVKLDGNHLTVKGPKGTLERDINKNISLEIDGNVINVKRAKSNGALIGESLMKSDNIRKTLEEYINAR